MAFRIHVNLINLGNFLCFTWNLIHFPSNKLQTLISKYLNPTQTMSTLLKNFRLYSFKAFPTAVNWIFPLLCSQNVLSRIQNYMLHRFWTFKPNQACPQCFWHNLLRHEAHNFRITRSTFRKLHQTLWIWSNNNSKQKSITFRLFFDFSLEKRILLVNKHRWKLLCPLAKQRSKLSRAALFVLLSTSLKCCFKFFTLNGKLFSKKRRNPRQGLLSPRKLI